MEIGLGLPTFTPNPSGSLILEFARIADEGGLDAVWSIDRLIFPAVEVLATLAAVAGATRRVRIGSDVLLAPTREPVVLASQLASIDVLSHGRLVVGIGVGSRHEDYIAVGRDFHTRGRRLDADVALMRRIWAGESIVEGFGRTGPPPVQQPIPLLFGGSSPQALARAARLGDGYMGIPRGVDQQREALQKFRTVWAEAGRPEKPITYAQGYFCVAPTVEQAHDRIAAAQLHYYGTRQRASGGRPDMSEFNMAGPPEVVARAMKEYEGLGVDGIILIPASDDLAQAEAVIGPVLGAYRKLSP